MEGIPHNYSELIQYIFYGVMSSLGVCVVVIANEMRKAISNLNIKMAVIVEKVRAHDRELNELRTFISRKSR